MVYIVFYGITYEQEQTNAIFIIPRTELYFTEFIFVINFWICNSSASVLPRSQLLPFYITFPNPIYLFDVVELRSLRDPFYFVGQHDIDYVEFVENAKPVFHVCIEKLSFLIISSQQRRMIQWLSARDAINRYVWVVHLYRGPWLLWFPKGLTRAFPSLDMATNKV